MTGALTLAREAKRVRSAGRYGDSELVHLNPGEFEFLRSLGAPTINPETGLPEFFSLGKIFGGLGKALPVVAPLALSVLFPGVGTAIGEALGASGAWAPILGNAIASGGLGALTGGAKGALLGAGTGALSSALAPVAGNALAGTSLGNSLGISGGAPTVFDALGAGAADSGAAAGLTGALDGAGPGATMLATPLEGGGADLTNLAAGDAPVDIGGSADIGWSGGADLPTPDIKPDAPQSLLAKYKTPLLLGGGALALSGLSGQGQPVSGTPVAAGSNTTGIYSTGPGPQVEFNRDYIGSSDPQDYYTYGRRPFSFFDNNSVTQRASGGYLQGGRYVESSGESGRADDIPAKLSSNEYVMDAETVGLLGDGNPDAGAKKLDQLRTQLRQQKGKQLAKGKFSTAAKPAASYMKGAA